MTDFTKPWPCRLDNFAVSQNFSRIQACTIENYGKYEFIIILSWPWPNDFGILTWLWYYYVISADLD